VTAIADHLIQVLMNLLINASDALEDVTERKPLISVATGADGDVVWISVNDNGVGMDAKILAHAFEKSFTTKPLGRGRGLGLFLCKALLEEGGHRIEMTSTINVGTMVCIRLMGTSTSGD
jgi:C4-dicarboxylate-specific signal transduction histidine kinase